MYTIEYFSKWQGGEWIELHEFETEAEAREEWAAITDGPIYGPLRLRKDEEVLEHVGPKAHA